MREKLQLTSTGLFISCQKKKASYISMNRLYSVESAPFSKRSWDERKKKEQVMGTIKGMDWERRKKRQWGQVGGVTSPFCWPVFFEVSTGWLGTPRAGQRTSHSRLHTFKTLSQSSRVGCLDLHTRTNLSQALSRHKTVRHAGDPWGKIGL